MRKIAVFGGVLMALALAAGVAAADPQPAARAHVGHNPARLVERFDTNKDGKLQVSELPDRLRARLASADTNSDGVLTVDELTAHAAKMRQARFAADDKNKDGALDASEVGAERWARIQVADANKDGKVTQAELAAAHASGALHGGSRAHVRGHGRGAGRK